MGFNFRPSYRRYQRYFVDLRTLYQKKEIVVWTGLVLSLFAIAFFGLFALRPTLLTIAKLLKERQDKIAINQKLQEKINHLRQAQTNYSLIAASLNLIDQALPQNPSLAEIVEPIEVLAQKSNLHLLSLTFEPVDLRGRNPSQKAIPKTPFEPKEMVFNLTLRGSFENLQIFLKALENLRRLIVIDSFTLSKSQAEESQEIILTLSGQTYYLPKEIK